MGLESAENDLILWRAIKNNDEGAFKSLFDRYYTRLCDYANLYLRDITVTKEIVADVFFNIWQLRKSLEVTRSLKAYLFTSVRNHSLNYLKGQKLKIVPLTEYIENGSDNFIDGEKILLFDELGSMVANAISKLPERQKEIFKMSRIYGMSYKEISDTLSISVNTVQEHMVSAMKNMRERLKRYVY